MLIWICHYVLLPGIREQAECDPDFQRTEKNTDEAVNDMEQTQTRAIHRSQAAGQQKAQGESKTSPYNHKCTFFKNLSYPGCNLGS